MDGAVMWIMLITKLPTEVSPPKMSIHWSTPWPDDHYAKDQMNQIKEKQARRPASGYDYEYIVEVIGDDPEKATFYNTFGQDPNWIGARRINYKGEDIRVFPHEFSGVKPNNLKQYVEESHELIESSVASNTRKLKLNPDQQDIFSAALLDGCNEAQANLTLLGIEITEIEIDIPPIGWYRCRKEYAEFYCNEREMRE